MSLLSLLINLMHPCVIKKLKKLLKGSVIILALGSK